MCLCIVQKLGISNLMDNQNQERIILFYCSGYQYLRTNITKNKPAPKKTQNQNQHSRPPNQLKQNVALVKINNEKVYEKYFWLSRNKSLKHVT